MSWVPSWWEFLLLAAAVYRIWRLFSEDTILDRPRKWVLGLPPSFDADAEDPTSYPNYREHLATFLTCPWCMGFWMSVLAWTAWLITPVGAVAAAVPWALSAAVGVAAKHLE